MASSVAEPKLQTMTNLVVQPIPQLVAQSVTQSVAQPMVQSVSQPMTNSSSKKRKSAEYLAANQTISSLPQFQFQVFLTFFHFILN